MLSNYLLIAVSRNRLTEKEIEDLTQPQLTKLKDLGVIKEDTETKVLVINSSMFKEDIERELEDHYHTDVVAQVVYHEDINKAPKFYDYIDKLIDKNKYDLAASYVNILKSIEGLKPGENVFSKIPTHPAVNTSFKLRTEQQLLTNIYDLIKDESNADTEIDIGELDRLVNLHTTNGNKLFGYVLIVDTLVGMCLSASNIPRIYVETRKLKKLHLADNVSILKTHDVRFKNKAVLCKMVMGNTIGMYYYPIMVANIKEPESRVTAIPVNI